MQDRLQILWAAAALIADEIPNATIAQLGDDPAMTWGDYIIIIIDPPQRQHHIAARAIIKEHQIIVYSYVNGHTIVAELADPDYPITIAKAIIADFDLTS